MCIAAFVWQSHPLYPLLLLLNRDEYHNRPTKPLAWWEGCDILGGRDEVAGGTWLACSRQGRVAFLTNVLELRPRLRPFSRGELPVKFLESRKSPHEYAEEITKEGDEYNGFNLIVADIASKTMVYVSNRPEGEPPTIQEISPGIHVLSNAKLGIPWHKVQRLRGKFKELLGKYGESDIPIKEMIEKLMRDTVKADESMLPHICALDWECDQSSIFTDTETKMGHFGTRSTAALTVTATGEVTFYETCLEKEIWAEKTVNYCIENMK
ncbi:hypothetical protein AAG906_030226 [Vitis piasezkii]